jgi:CrcB protein
MIAKLLMVALGGAAGSVARYGAGLALPFPLATAVINIAGSLLIGLVWVTLDPRSHPLLIVGVLGGFTTFSAFSLETLRLAESGRPGVALAYVGGSVILSLFACWVGVTLGRALA